MSTTKDILLGYSAELLQKLPMTNPMFLNLLETHNLLNEYRRQMIEAKDTMLNKADYLINHVIRTDTDLCLPIFLDAMDRYSEKYNDVAISELAKKIREDLPGSYIKLYLCTYIASTHFYCSSYSTYIGTLPYIHKTCL